MALNPLGTLLASASELGHLIRLFDPRTGEALQELKRGSSRATIETLIFHPTRNFLACSSNKQSVHIFDVSSAAGKSSRLPARKEDSSSNSVTTEAGEDSRPGPAVQLMKALNKYWDGDSCFTKVKVNEKLKQIAFDSKNGRLSIATFDRTIYSVEIPDAQMRYVG